LADLHFTPTRDSDANLIREGVPPEHIEVTGNTVIDALLWMRDKLHRDNWRPAPESPLKVLSDNQRMVLITGHRRENFGSGFERICLALAELALRYPDVQFLYPVHLNPQVQHAVYSVLSGRDNIHLVAPQDYPHFVWLMNRAHIILTDSGGVQEEAPHLGKPVLVMRDVTERPEAVAAGTAQLVGTAPERILGAARRLLDDPDAYADVRRRGNPYGDGHACRRIVDALCGRPVAEFAPPPLQPASVPSLDFA
uniref:non-hydrolyzing UDP-N-acetylglucosamine 2-epimerase n=1 Tax=uncultured Pseudacidovorax sp. TaxID=679313 RepID=UPI0025E9374A